MSSWPGGIRPGLDVPIQKGGHQVAPDWQPRAGTALTCGDVQVRPDFCSRGRLIAPSIHIRRPDHSANLLEPSVCMIRSQGCWPFCPGGCSRERLYPFRPRTEASWSTMDRGASMKGTASPGFAGAERCGGVMVRRPQSGNGTRSPVYYLNSAGLVPPRSRALCGQTDPPAAGMRADGSPAAAPGLGGSWHDRRPAAWRTGSRLGRGGVGWSPASPPGCLRRRRFRHPRRPSVVRIRWPRASC